MRFRRQSDSSTRVLCETKEVSESIRAFLQYVDGVITSDRFVQEIDEEIQKVKMIEGEAVGYMAYEMKMKEERKEGIKEGRREGRKETQQVTLQVIPLLLANTPLEQISHLTGCTIEYLRQIKAALSPESGSVT